MKMLTLSLLALLTFGLVNDTSAQAPPEPEHAIFKSDVGVWDAEIKAWQGPGEPTITKGLEENRMLGEYWRVSNFEGKLFGFDFKGHGVYGYDAKKKVYTGLWIDSLGATRMEMTGKYDKEAKKMTYTGMALGPDGKEAKHTLTTTQNADGTRLMTMHVGEGENAFKMMEIKTTKRPEKK